MHSESNKILLESIKRLLRRDATSHLLKIVKKTHAADLASVFDFLSIHNQRRLFKLIDNVSLKGEIFSNLDEDTFLGLVDGMNLDDIVEILDLMPRDDVADLLGCMPVERSDAILEKMKKEGSKEVEGLLHYEDDTAGGIMVPEFIALQEDTTAGEAIQSLQKEHLDVEMPFYLYVVDTNGKLIGVSSLRQLVVVPPKTPLKNFMTTDVFAVKTNMDQEEVAKIVARYDILAVPVVDDTNKLVGIVTVDDVIDIIREEATEDILKMVGVGEEFVETTSIFKNIKMRMPWLFASCVGGIIASFIIGYFQSSLSKLAYLAAFIPVIMGMGGNIGVQSATITVRGLATGRLNIRDIWSVVSKQLMVGLMLGLFYGFVVGLVAQLKYSREWFALAVGLGVLSSMTLAALAGSLVPMTLAKINVDPAIASGPFVTTAIDIISVTFYFVIATTLLGI
ncbi:MAG: magnesium transporter [Desulfobacteraceae bacterium]|nr:magnesium transporter [Desulfobacteraceae bacterium]